MGEKHLDKLYIGIDLGEESVMLSYYHRGMEVPSTISTIAGSGNYQIPLAMAKRIGMGQWTYGQDAQRLEREGKGILVDRLLERGARGESVEIEGREYQISELFILYLKKILQMPNKLDISRPVAKLVLAVRKMNPEYMELFENLRKKLGFSVEEFEVIDHKECFYFYSCNQEEALKQHQVGLFDCRETEMVYYDLSKKRGTRPTVVEIEECTLGSLEGDYDKSFLEMAQTVLGGKITSAVYFVGDIFEGNWMEESLRYVCRGRRAFIGKNLYSMGACFAAYLKGNEEEWGYVYLGESEFKMNISLKVWEHSELKFYTLVEAGENWYHNRHSCQVLLDGTNTVDLWLQHPFGREARIENLELADLPQRPNKTTRISITADTLSDTSVEITIQDLGFGEIFPTSGKIWKYKMEF